MDKDGLEPGIIPVMRLFASLQFGVYFVEFFRSFHHTLLGKPLANPVQNTIHETVGWLLHMAFGMPYEFDRYYVYVLFNFAIAIFMMIYFWWGKIRRNLGVAFLPLALFIASLSPIVSDAIKYLEIYRYTNLDTRILVGAWQSAILLFIPMTILAWQYGLFMVVIFCTATMLLDLFFKVVLMADDLEYLIPLIAIILMRSVIYMILGYIIARLSTAQKGQRRELALANERLAQYASTLEQLTISRERNRLAHEMHDTLAHTLSGIAVQLEAVLSTWEQGSQKTQDMVEQALAATRSGLTETRRALRALRASPLEDLGLANALHGLAESVSERAGFKISLSMPQDLPQFNFQCEQGIFRIAQEIFENIAKHAQAKNVRFEAGQSADEWRMSISDDGIGFEMKDVRKADHFGLRGMQERAEMIGGRLQVESKPGRGTAVQFSIPLVKGTCVQGERRVA